MRDHRAVLRRHVVEPVGRREAGDPDHVLRDEVGIAGDEAAHVPRQHAAVEVEAGPDLVPDHHRQLAAGIEALDILRDAACKEKAKASATAHAIFSVMAPSG